MSPTHPPLDDTDPAADEFQFELLRRMSDQEKIRLVGELCDTVRYLAAMGIRERYPAATETEVKMRLASNWLDRETLIRCYGWDPLEH